jgi:hypothetical protein
MRMAQKAPPYERWQLIPLSELDPELKYTGAAGFGQMLTCPAEGCRLKIQIVTGPDRPGLYARVLEILPLDHQGEDP